MRLVLQRVDSATVTVDGVVTGSIGKGLLIFAGFGRGDSPEILPNYAKKVSELRMFSDPDGKINLSLRDVGGSILLVSQFTLYANCTRGRRPDFTPAAPPELARALYEELILRFRELDLEVRTGIFAADMRVELINDGPVTIILDSDTN